MRLILITALAFCFSPPLFGEPLGRAELAHAIVRRIDRVPELAAVAKVAKDLGMRAWLVGQTAASYANYVRADLIARRFADVGSSYRFGDIFQFGSQPIEIGLDGHPEMIAALEIMIWKQFPYLVGGESGWELKPMDEWRVRARSQESAGSQAFGAIEVTGPPQARVISDLDPRNWFLHDLNNGVVHFFPSAARHPEAPKGRPEVFAVIQALMPVLQHGLTLPAADRKQMARVVAAFDPEKDLAVLWAREWLERNGKDLYLHAADPIEADRLLRSLGLSRKLAAAGDPSAVGSLAWWAAGRKRDPGHFTDRSPALVPRAPDPPLPCPKIWARVQHVDRIDRWITRGAIATVGTVGSAVVGKTGYYYYDYHYYDSFPWHDCAEASRLPWREVVDQLDEHYRWILTQPGVNKKDPNCEGFLEACQLALTVRAEPADYVATYRRSRPLAAQIVGLGAAVGLTIGEVNRLLITLRIVPQDVARLRALFQASQPNGDAAAFAEALHLERRIAAGPPDFGEIAKLTVQGNLRFTSHELRQLLDEADALPRPEGPSLAQRLRAAFQFLEQWKPLDDEKKEAVIALTGLNSLPRNPEGFRKSYDIARWGRFSVADSVRFAHEIETDPDLSRKPDEARRLLAAACALFGAKDCDDTLGWMKALIRHRAEPLPQ